MEINLAVIINSVEILKKLANQPVPAKAAFRIGKVIRAVNQEVEAFEETRHKLFRAYGEEKDGQIKVKTEHQEEFFKELNDLLESHVEMEIPELFVDDLEKIDISAAEINAISFILTEERKGA